MVPWYSSDWTRSTQEGTGASAHGTATSAASTIQIVTSVVDPSPRSARSPTDGVHTAGPVLRVP